MKRIILILFCIASCMETGCRKETPSHDASKPVVIDSFYPTTGGVGTDILIVGDNFSDDPSQVSVKVGGRDLVVVNSSMTSIMVVVPRKLGSGKLEVSISGGTPVLSEETFEYIFTIIVSTLAGTGESGYFDGPASDAVFSFNDADQGGWRKGCICVDNDGNVYVNDIVNQVIRKISSEGEVTTFAGARGQSGTIDGKGANARITDIYGMDCDAEGNIYFSDYAATRLRKATPNGEVTTLPHVPPSWPTYLAVDKRNGDVYLIADGGVHRYDGSSFTLVYSGQANAVAVGGDYLYISNTNSHQIIRANIQTGQSEVFAGSTQGLEDGKLKEAQFTNPLGLVVDASGDLFIAGNGSWNGGDNADQSIRRIDMAAGEVITIAGSGQAGSVNGSGKTATFHGPQDITADNDGNFYVFDKMNNMVRKISYE